MRLLPFLFSPLSSKDHQNAMLNAILAGLYGLIKRTKDKRLRVKNPVCLPMKALKITTCKMPHSEDSKT